MAEPKAVSAQRLNAEAWDNPKAAHIYRKADGLLPAECAILDANAAEVAGARLLDLGVGTGRTTPHLMRRCRAYVGIDYSGAMLERAAARFPDAELFQADARDLGPWQDGSFDVVVFSYNGMDYVGHEDRLRVLREVHRVLRPGGLFAFSTHNRDVDVPAAWSLRNLHLSANPARTAYNSYLYVSGIANSRRAKPLERSEDEYALTNDPGLHYRLVTYYISRPAQLAQLERAGFGSVSAFGLDGTALPIDGPPVTDFMIHYSARKIAQS